MPVKPETYTHLSGTRLSLEGDMLESDLLKASRERAGPDYLWTETCRPGKAEPCIIDYGHGKIFALPVKPETYTHLSGTRLSLGGDTLDFNSLKATIGGGVPMAHLGRYAYCRQSIVARRVRLRRFGCLSVSIGVHP